jgi:NTP pyrophosphatase (non-canonical NTP hydrolase)
MNSLQEEVYQAVAGRGYLNPEKWSKDQLIARQVVKLAEELGEMAEHVHGEEFSALHGLLTKVIKVGRIAKIVFDRDPFEEVIIDKNDLRGELADVQVVTFVLATLLGIDIDEEAHIKATLDVPRGVSC